MNHFFRPGQVLAVALALTLLGALPSVQACRPEPQAAQVAASAPRPASAPAAAAAIASATLVHPDAAQIERLRASLPRPRTRDEVQSELDTARARHEPLHRGELD